MSASGERVFFSLPFNALFVFFSQRVTVHVVTGRTKGQVGLGAEIVLCGGCGGG